MFAAKEYLQSLEAEGMPPHEEKTHQVGWDLNQRSALLLYTVDVMGILILSRQSKLYYTFIRTHRIFLFLFSRLSDFFWSPTEYTKLSANINEKISKIETYTEVGTYL